MSARHFIVKSLVSGSVMSLASIAAVGRQAYFTGNLFGKYYELPIWSICGGVGAVASLVSDGIHTLMEENIPVNKKIDHQLAVATGIGITTGAFALTLYSLNPSSIQEMGLLKIGLMGALSEITSSYVCNMVCPEEDFYL